MLAPAAALTLIALTAARAQACNTFNITELDVPQVVTPEQKEVEIGCTYDANFTILSWFKGPNEFFRYRPGVTPSTRSFPILGVGRIEMIVCGPVNCRLRLGSLTEEASGLYRCDLEKVVAPYKFATRSAYMQVYGHHHRRPLVEGLAEEYGEGDEIMARCRTAAPDAEIRWYINGREMIDMRHSDIMKTRTSRLFFMGIPPKVSVQCAEFQYGNLSGSKEVKARWREPSKKEERAQEQRKNSAPVEKNVNLFWISSSIVLSILVT